MPIFFINEEEPVTVILIVLLEFSYTLLFTQLLPQVNLM